MAWRDELTRVVVDGKRTVAATFRGVPFYVESAEKHGGRRLAKHEYPGKDEPFAEDMGRRGRSFPVEGYVVGADYITARDALIAKLEEKGQGELVHPYYGTLRVMVDGYRVSISTRDGGIARFSVDFIETPAQASQPTAVVDAAAKVAASAAKARTATEAEFLVKFLPGPLFTSIADGLRSATLAIDSALSTVAVEMQALAVLKQQTSAFADSVLDLVHEPDDIAAQLIAILDITDIGSKLLSVYDFNPGVRPPDTTSNRLQEQTNFDALQRLVQRLTVIRVAESLPAQTFDSFEAALLARDAVTDLLDEQLEVAEDDTFPALVQLRADLARAVPGEGKDLPHLVTHSPAFTVPSLVLAHNLYGDVSLEQDILTRNGVSNPLLVPGGLPLQVLSRDE